MLLSHVFRLCVLSGCRPVPAMTESPFAWLGALPRPGERDPLFRSALPDPPRSYGLMRQTSSLWNPLLSLWAPVFAGCCETLLAGGPSRRYLRKSFPRCLVPYPGASPGAPTRYFPGDIGLYQLGNGSATRTMPYDDFCTGVLLGAADIRSCSGLWVCSPPRSLLPPGLIETRGSRGFYVRASHGLLPCRASDMLAVRIGQLTAWGLTPH